MTTQSKGPFRGKPSSDAESQAPGNPAIPLKFRSPQTRHGELDQGLRSVGSG